MNGINQGSLRNERPVSTDIGRGSKLPKTLLVVVIVFVVAIGLAMLAWTTYSIATGGGKHGTSDHRGSSVAENAAGCEPIGGRYVTGNDISWQGRSNHDQTKTMQCWITTPNVEWEVRLDRDDSKVWTNYPATYKGNVPKLLNLPDFTVLEVKVRPGQTVRTAEFEFLLVPRVNTR